MKVASKIFRRNDFYVTSPFGYRVHPITKKYTYHAGVDYGTNAKNWAQYAIEDGYVYTTGYNKSGYGNYIWVRYPRINRSFLHAHLKSISVKSGQKVKEGTLLGYTGTTGNSTGIHLHLGMTEIGKSTWLNPDKYNYTAPSKGDATIKTIQTTFNSRYGKVLGKLTVDGIAGANTKKMLVKAVQYELNKQYGTKLGIDGVFGVTTKKNWKSLKKGSKGNTTWLCQARLYIAGYSANGLDGVFGNGMLTNVKKYQKAKKLTVDGIIGGNTAYKIFN